MPHGSPDPTCPNCGRDRPEGFCPRCGQSDQDYARSFRSVAGELLGETFQLDSRLSRTLKLLLLKPGGLTREFSRNRRAEYVSPVRLYIFASFVFFLTMSVTVASGYRSIEATISVPNPAALDSLRVNDTLIDALKAVLSVEHVEKLDAILARPEEDLSRQTVLLRLVSSEHPSEMGFLDRVMVPGTIDILYEPAIVGQRFVANMPIAMFFLLPVFALALAACYFRRKRFYTEHLVFAFHVQTVAFLILTLVQILPDHGPGVWVRRGLFLAPYPYFLIALRRYYQDGWVWTVAKSIGVGFLYLLALVPAVTIAILVTT